LKGLWVKNGNNIVVNGKYVGVAGANDHNLIQLSKAVGFSPTMAESDVLQHLSRFVRFAGRYPVAKTLDEMRPLEMPVIGKVDVGFFSERDFRTAQSTLNKIIKQDFREEATRDTPAKIAFPLYHARQTTEASVHGKIRI
jgi:hypothetical protein